MMLNQHATGELVASLGVGHQIHGGLTAILKALLQANESRSKGLLLETVSREWLIIRLTFGSLFVKGIPLCNIFGLNAEPHIPSNLVLWFEYKLKLRALVPVLTLTQNSYDHPQMPFWPF